MKRPIVDLPSSEWVVMPHFDDFPRPIMTPFGCAGFAYSDEEYRRLTRRHRKITLFALGFMFVCIFGGLAFLFLNLSGFMTKWGL